MLAVNTRRYERIVKLSLLDIAHRSAKDSAQLNRKTQRDLSSSPQELDDPWFLYLQHTAYSITIKPTSSTAQVSLCFISALWFWQIHTYIYIYIHTHIRVRSHTHTHTHTHTHIYIYIYILSSTDRLFRSIRNLHCG